MENFTIHIFGYGETQINSSEFSVKTGTTELQTVTPLIEAIWALNPSGTTGEKKYHVIHIFSHDDVRWLSKEGFSLKKQTSLTPLIDTLIEELRVVRENNPKPVE